ncbi:hypothetical protein [Uliginosibacterium sp. 31-12]|uniref:hypothetical protein n=1 Tax=Uliginosibacterium sp. 31-12 TaxID=3062781 RepID=UPI0026E297A6|nr:hypothetical protein [Uliginosibacterium sp. 31-12]MDO6388462.1 hypothetical protein [Uliginosibacterium sp. 31-12]
MRFLTKLAVGCSALAMPALAYADVVWPALYLETRLFSWWAISIGLIAEVIFVKWLFAIPMKRAAIVTTVANAASSVAGILLIPLAGIAWEFFPGLLYMKALNWGTFNPITWLATFVLACLVNTAIESFVYRKAYQFPIKRREFGWIFIANAVSVGVAFGSLFVVPIQP